MGNAVYTYIFQLVKVTDIVKLKFYKRLREDIRSVYHAHGTKSLKHFHSGSTIEKGEECYSWISVIKKCSNSLGRQQSEKDKIYAALLFPSEKRFV